MTQRVINKSLAGEQDLLLGTGTAVQSRNGVDYTINKLDLIKPVATLAELNALDTAKFTKASLNGVPYVWSGTAWTPAELLQTVDTLVALQAVVSPIAGKQYQMSARTDPTDVLDEAGGTFTAMVGDYSTQVAADEVTTGQGDGGIWVAFGADKTGASGAFKRIQKHSRSSQPQWYGAKGQGGDENAAIQAMARYADSQGDQGWSVMFTIGSWYMTEKIEFTTPVMVLGPATDRVFLIWGPDATSEGIDWDLTGLSTDFGIHASGFTGMSGRTREGDFLTAKFKGRESSVIFRDINSVAYGANGVWREHCKLTNPTEGLIDNCIFRATVGEVSSVGIHVIDDNNSGSSTGTFGLTINNGGCYDTDTAIKVRSDSTTSQIGIEGLRILNNDLVNCLIGIDALHTGSAGGYIPPQLVIFDNHINPRLNVGRAMTITRFSQIYMSMNNIYNVNNSVSCCAFVNCDTVKVYENDILSIISGCTSAVSFEDTGAYAGAKYYDISHNTFDMGAGNGNAAVRALAGTDNFTVADNNLRQGDLLWLMDGGEYGKNIRWSNNSHNPFSLLAIPDLTSVPTVKSCPSNTYLTLNTGATSITDLFGKTGEIVNILVNDSNTTFTHGANLVMKSGANYAAPSGAILTFLMESNTKAREVSRSI